MEDTSKDISDMDTTKKLLLKAMSIFKRSGGFIKLFERQVYTIDRVIYYSLLITIDVPKMFDSSGLYR